MKPKILVTEPIPDKVITHLSSFGKIIQGERGEYNTEEDLIAGLQHADALLCMLSTPVSRKVIENAPKLKVIANFAVGYDNIDVNAAHEKGIRVANTPDVLTEACGDFAMGLLMAVTRKFNEAEQYLREGKFKGWEPLGFLGMELRGKTLGIIGMGRIGQSFAHRARAFGMNIAYHNRNPLPDDITHALDAVYYTDHRQLAREADVLSLNCPLTEGTHHLVDEDILKIMPDHAYLINISRGPVVDEAALARALKEGQIAGAGLDVFEEEPEVHPELIQAPNATILPHIASATFETREAIGMLAANAIISVLKGKKDSEIPNLITG
ncbi:2-hydroxyacid dehydrogenase [Balneola sp. MJW-20]|uniref:2-hydroxyacid dehydrogenase n=1 Tax=Gracilimonas aurantiaca TaxID=3234185 RepID=UPI003466B4B4